MKKRIGRVIAVLLGVLCLMMVGKTTSKAAMTDEELIQNYLVITEGVECDDVKIINSNSVQYNEDGIEYRAFDGDRVVCVGWINRNYVEHKVQ